MSISPGIFKHIIVFAYFFCASTYLTFPLLFNLQHFLPGTVDELYITWILNWNIHALSNDFLGLFNGNIYFPYENSISFSDLHLTSSLIAFFPVKFFGEPLIAYTLNLFLSFVLLGFFTYLLLYFLTSDRASSITAGTICAFSTYLLPKLGQLQVLTIYWIPLTLLFYFLFIRTKKFRFFIFSLITFYLQFINSFMPAYFLLFLLFALSLFEIYKDRAKIKIFINRKTLFAILFLILFCIPIIIPYYQTSIQFNYVRDIRDAIHTANRPEHFFLNFGRSHVGPIFTTLLYKTPPILAYDGYRGLVNIVLTILALFVLFFRKKPQYFTFFAIAGIFTYIISLGPALQWGGHVLKFPFIIPLPYALLYYLAPGFKGFRNSGRWEVYEIFAFCIAIGLMLSFLLKKSDKRWIINLILSAGVLAEFTFPIHYFQLPTRSEMPPVYRYLQTLSDNAVIIELPIYNWSMFPYSFEENKRLYYSTTHFKKTVNGGGGFSPYPWQEFVVKVASEFPNQEVIESLKRIGVKYIVLHESEYNLLFENNFTVNNKRVPNAKSIKSSLLQSNKVKYIKTFGTDSVYLID